MIASGTRIRQYEILSLLGSGGMGEVYLAIDHTLERRVAMKFLPLERSSDERASRRLVQEARAAAQLDHPNICAIHEIGEDGTRHFLVMPFVEGETLAVRLKGGPLVPRDALEVAIQVASALAEAHARGIVHRDIKPQNIMLTPRHQVKVLDFGIAMSAGGASGPDAETATRLTTPGTVLGTWPYMSPEQVRGEELDGRSDLFSLGAVLFEMAWGAPPFQAPTAAEVIAKVLTWDPLPAGGPDAGRLPALAPIVRCCLEKERSLRYQSANELLADLERARFALAADRGEEAADSTGAGPPAAAVAPRVNRRALALVALLAVVAIAAGALVWRTAQSHTAAPPGRTASSAYDDYVRGKVKVKLLTREDVDAAIRLFQGAVAADPGFAPAHAELARASIFKAFQFSDAAEQKQLLEDAGVEIEKALAIDPNLAEAHLARGLLVWTHDRNFPHALAIRAYRRAIELNPNLDEAHHELAVVYMHVGLLDKAWDEIQRTLALNPDNMLARVRAGTILLYRGDYAEAAAALEGAPEGASPSYRSRALADALFRQGRTQQTAEVVDAYLQRHPTDEGGSLTSVKALLLAREGDRIGTEDAIREARQLGESAGHYHHTAYNIGCAHALLGAPAEAVRYLRIAAGDGFPCYPYYEHDPALDPIRHDPAFLVFLGELKAQWEGFQRLE